MTDLWVGIPIQADFIPIKNFKESLGLLFEFFGTFANFCDDFLVGERFKTIVDVASVLMGPHETLCTIEESLLDLHE